MENENKKTIRVESHEFLEFNKIEGIRGISIDKVENVRVLVQEYELNELILEGKTLISGNVISGSDEIPLMSNTPFTVFFKDNPIIESIFITDLQVVEIVNQGLEITFILNLDYEIDNSEYGSASDSYSDDIEYFRGSGENEELAESLTADESEFDVIEEIGEAGDCRPITVTSEYSYEQIDVFPNFDLEPISLEDLNLEVALDKKEPEVPNIDRFHAEIEELKLQAAKRIHEILQDKLETPAVVTQNTSTNELTSRLRSSVVTYHVTLPGSK